MKKTLSVALIICVGITCFLWDRGTAKPLLVLTTVSTATPIDLVSAPPATVNLKSKQRHPQVVKPARTIASAEDSVENSNALGVSDSAFMAEVEAARRNGELMNSKWEEYREDAYNSVLNDQEYYFIEEERLHLQRLQNEILQGRDDFTLEGVSIEEIAQLETVHKQFVSTVEDLLGQQRLSMLKNVRDRFDQEVAKGTSLITIGDQW